MGVGLGCVFGLVFIGSSFSVRVGVEFEKWICFMIILCKSVLVRISRIFIFIFILVGFEVRFVGLGFGDLEGNRIKFCFYLRGV